MLIILRVKLHQKNRNEKGFERWVIEGKPNLTRMNEEVFKEKILWTFSQSRMSKLFKDSESVLTTTK